MPKDHGIGAPLKRREDVRFLTGKGRYTDDINRPGQAYVHFLRSDVAHGKITRLDTARGRRDARRAPRLHRRRLQDRRQPALRLAGHQPRRLQRSRSRATRSSPKASSATSARPIAAVVAETLAQARDAAEAIELDIEELPAVVDMPRRRSRPTRRRCTRASPRTSASTGASSRTTRPRSTPPSRPRTTSPRSSWSTTASSPTPWSRARRWPSTTPATDEYTLFTTSQNPHVIRLLMSAFVLGIPETKLRVVAPDVGGGFGSKIFHYGEEAFVTRAAQVARPAGEVDLQPLRGLRHRRPGPRPRDHEDPARASTRTACSSPSAPRPTPTSAPTSGSSPR